ncbi:gluconate 2-dehydrogenase subunit 3 family protein [Paraburkholderia aromaticivorans]|uniref:gluconate 2-dehydrogenase subunit 3 family protein n=1 Tax=Paraburkholderia aromaticivorans TaxID=2026199 RepID=UPI0014561261|nr:gluconate 2-dehydrogenase subunit 3 family protein [Paraburkholderia aromaticivorans]
MDANDKPNGRRNFLRKTVTLIPLGTLAACEQRATTQTGAASGSAVDQAQSPGSEAPYKPRYFDAGEWRFLEAACDRLIPADTNGPGAVQAGVPEFIDRQMDTPYAHGALWYMQAPFAEGVPELGYQSKLVPRDLYRLGIRAVDEYCLHERGKRFADLPTEQRDEVLSGLQKSRIEFDEVPAALFFAQLLQNTREGFFCDPIHGGNRHLVGWTMIGFPGARADFMDFVNQGGKRYPYGPVSISGEKA